MKREYQDAGGSGGDMGSSKDKMMVAAAGAGGKFGSLTASARKKSAQTEPNFGLPARPTFILGMICRGSW